MIQKRGNGYGVRIYRAGKQEWVGTYAKRGEARKAEREAFNKLRPSQDETGGEFAKRWLRDFRRPKASTNRTNAYAIKPFVADFENTKMADISRRRAREWALAHPRNVPAVRAMFNDALDEEVVVANPFAKLGLEQGRGRKDLDPISEEALNELADTALRVFGSYGPTFRACIIFAAYVGLRPAELFRLKRSDIVGDEVRIRRSLGSTGEVTLPKNGLARTVILPPPARQALREMPTVANSPYVFHTKRGKPFSKSSHYYYWNTVRAASGLPMETDFYELRHFCATDLLERGVTPWDVAIQLGHTDGGALVTSTYGHPSEEEARKRLLRAYGRQVTPLRSVGGD